MAKRAKGAASDLATLFTATYMKRHRRQIFDVMTLTVRYHMKVIEKVRQKDEYRTTSYVFTQSMTRRYRGTAAFL